MFVDKKINLNMHYFENIDMNDDILNEYLIDHYHIFDM